MIRTVLAALAATTVPVGGVSAVSYERYAAATSQQAECPLPAAGTALLPQFKTASAETGAPIRLLLAVGWQESGFNQRSQSLAGAQGVMQLMPSTARALGVDSAKVEENILGGSRYLAAQLEAFGDETKALAAYNAGPAAVQRYDGTPPYRETQDYVRKVTAHRDELEACTALGDESATLPVAMGFGEWVQSSLRRLWHSSEPAVDKAWAQGLQKVSEADWRVHRGDMPATAALFDRASDWAQLPEAGADEPVTATDGGREDLSVVGGITVADSLAQPLSELLSAAEADGIRGLSGWGWRSTERQAQLWHEHGCDDGSCSVPTARPGHSMHELGQAIDFTVDGETLRQSDPAFRWLQQHAGEYGLRNLPSESWHWSTNGR